VLVALTQALALTLVLALVLVLGTAVYTDARVCAGNGSIFLLARDFVCFRVLSCRPMSDQEKEELEQRIELDIDSGVDSQEHHDPQYDGRSSLRSTWLPRFCVLSVLFVPFVLFVCLAQTAVRWLHATHQVCQPACIAALQLASNRLLTRSSHCPDIIALE
jgi:hypothetical protein